MKKIGNIDDAEIKIVNVFHFSGSVIPLRNLNLPKESYDLLELVDPKTTLSIGTYFKLKKPGKMLRNFNKFHDLDLKSMNSSYSQGAHLETLTELLTLLDKYPLAIKCIDAALTTSCKIIVLDKSGNVRYGEDNDFKNFRYLTMETVLDVDGPLAGIMT